ncbi:MAG TPA: transglutaminase family protein [Pirellulales bacterium]|nr:transglutaminase family protein [Pirellulales bacterium]
MRTAIHLCRSGGARALLATIVVALAVCSGCSASESASAEKQARAIGATASMTPPTERAPAATPSDFAGLQAASTHPANPLQDGWFAMYIEGTKVGYGKTVTNRVVEHGQALNQVVEEVHFSVVRNGQPSDERVVSTGIETPTGQLLRFRTEIESGSAPIVTTGEVRDGDMCFQTISTGTVTRTFLPWEARVGGFKATEQSLVARPMQPGERRNLKGLMVGFNQIAEIEMVAGAYEPTQMLNHSEELLRIQWTATLPKGNTIAAEWWMNRDGEVMKMQLDALRQVTFRTTREIALAETGPARFDLLLSTRVRVNRPLVRPNRTKRVRYRVQLESADPSRVFASCASQRVTPLDAHTAEIEVRAARPIRNAATAAAATATPADGIADPALNLAPPGSQQDSPPTEEDRTANSLVQCDDPRIIALAGQAAGSRTDPWEVAVALEKFTHDYITGRNYSKAFSTAVEVAESREGACTQHAVLLAALARARGLPARVAIGLVYTESTPGFAFHMWNEVWIGGRWIPLDATRGTGGVGAAQLKLADSSLAGEAAYSCFLPVSQVIGQIKIEILEVE